MTNHQDIIRISKLEAKCIIGVYDWERKKKQKVMIDVELPCDALRAAKRDRIEDALDYDQLSKQILDFVRDSKFKLIETLAEKTTQLILTQTRAPWVTLKLSKPNAIPAARTVSIQLHRP